MTFCVRKSERSRRVGEKGCLSNAVSLLAVRGGAVGIMTACPQRGPRGLEDDAYDVFYVGAG